MILPKFYFGPMSKELVDVVLENKFNVGFIPSRRQIDFSGGYVNNWTTKQFRDYVGTDVLIERDHGGPNQGTYEDDGLNSFIDDCSHFDIIHIDVWKKYQDLDDAVFQTARFIKLLNEKNPNIFFEVGTEQSIRPYEHKELRYFLTNLKKSLGETFSKILYCVVQCGTKLSTTENLGIFDENKLINMIEVCKEFGVKSKEHNGDYVSNDIRQQKLKLGLDSINIAPEFGVIQTNTIIKNLNEYEFDEFFNICYTSNKWKKWVPENFNPLLNRKEVVSICGHYNFTNEFVSELIADNLSYIKEELKLTIKSILDIK